MNHPKIFTLYNLPVKGEMGQKTHIEKKVACDACKRVENTEHRLSYQFNEWLGEDPGPPIITEGLFNKIKGFTKQKIALREAVSV